MSINLRIKQIREKLCDNVNQIFADKLGVSKQTTSNYVREGYSIGKGVVGDILMAFPQINKSWLLTGDGEMFKSTNLNNNSMEPKNEELISEFVKSLQKTIQSQEKTIQILEKQLESMEAKISELRENLGLLNKQTKEAM